MKPINYLYFSFLASDDRTPLKVEFTKSVKGNLLLIINKHRFFKKKVIKNRIFWFCCEKYRTDCTARVAQNIVTKRWEGVNLIKHNHKIVPEKKTKSVS